MASIANGLMSLFSRARTSLPNNSTGLGNVHIVHMPPITTIFNFPATQFWAMLSISPTSAIHSMASVSIFTRIQCREAHTDPEVLRPYFNSYLRSMEEGYILLVESSASSQSAQEMGTSSYMPQLKTHLALEKAAGRLIYPASRCGMGGRSEASSRAEKGTTTFSLFFSESHLLFVRPRRNM